MTLRPQDVLVTLKLLSPGAPREYARLAESLSMSGSEVHAGIKRAMAAGLVAPDRVVNRTALLEFLVHGVKYAFASERGRVTRGMPTAHGALQLSALIASGGEAPPVWPDARGTARGEALKPLYRSAPQAARRDAHLYALLSLVDAVRDGRARERSLAVAKLKALIAS